jgi:hypothetical protein
MVFVMARAEPKSRPIRLPALGAAGMIALAALSLGACTAVHVARTAFGPLQYDKSSPAAGAIATTDVRKLPYPSFLQVPSQPEDVRPTTAWNNNMFEALAARRQMDAFEVVFPQKLYGAEAFAQETRSLAAPPLTPEEVQAQTERAKAFATEGQARATPPSPAR